MSLTINFGTTNDPANCPNKTYTLIKTITGDATEPENFLNPSFLIDYDDDMLDCNYCEITDWEHFYFCKVVLEHGGNMRIICSPDPLRTWWYDYISKQPVTIVRSTSFEKPTYIQDGMLPIDEARLLPPKVIYFNSIHVKTGNFVDCYDILNTI